MRRLLTLAGAALLLAACTSESTSDSPRPVPAFGAYMVSGAGATVPFLEYEAEAADYSGQVVGPDRTAKTLAGEASGRMAVTLRSASDHVDFTLLQPANAVTVRYSVPDGVEGTISLTAEGAAAVELPTTGKYGWYYGGFPFTNNAADGNGHHLYDSVRGVADTRWGTGTKLSLRASKFPTTIDLADFELAPDPLPQPAGSVSVVDFGADPTGKSDSLNAFVQAATSAAASGKAIFIPKGRFLVPGHWNLSDVTVTGAGMWHSELRGQDVGIFGKQNLHLSDFAIIGEVTERVDSKPDNAIGGSLGGSTVERLWLQHKKVGLWLDGPFAGLTVRGCRIFDMTADGLNLHQGITDTLVTQNVIRNTGDDGLAMWSDQDQDQNNRFEHNTVQLPLLANGIGIYGGKNNQINFNVVADTLIEGAGIQLANRFSGTVPLDGTTHVEGNTLLRTGSRFEGIQTQPGAIFLFAKDSPITGKIELVHNSLLDSSYSGLHTFGSRVSDLRVDGLVVRRPGDYAVRLQSNGEGTLSGVEVTEPGKPGVYVCQDAQPFGLTIERSTGLESTHCGA